MKYTSDHEEVLTGACKAVHYKASHAELVIPVAGLCNPRGDYQNKAG